MTPTLERVTGPAVTPISLSEAKAHLRVDSTDEDTLIEGLISAAVSHFDARGLLGRAMITQTWAEYFPQYVERVRLSMTPFISLTSVQYYDKDNVLQTATLSDFETWKHGDYVILKAKENFQWPQGYTRPDAFKVTYQAGYGSSATDVPQSVRQAMLLAVAHWHEHRMAVDDTKMVELPMAVDALLANERVTWYG